MNQRKSWPRRSSIGAAAVPFLLFVEMVAFGANSPLLAVAAATANIAVAMLVLYLTAPDWKFWKGAAPVVGIVLAALLWIALPGLYDTPPGTPRAVPDLLLPGMVRLFGGLALLLAGGWIGYRRGMMRTAIRWITIFGVVNIAIGVGLRQYDPHRVWGVEKSILGDRFTGTLLNANSSGCFFGVLAILGLGGLLALLRGRSVVAPKRWEQLQLMLYALTVIGSVGACAITGSRTALALVLVVLPLMIVSDDVARRIASSTRGIVVGVVALIAIVIVGTLVGDKTFDRLPLLAENGNDRAMIWHHYWVLSQQAFWHGYGPLSFDTVNVQNLPNLPEAELLAYIHSPHNFILSLLFAGGWVYVMLIGLAGVMMLLQLFRRRRTRHQDPVLRAAILSASFIAACAMVDIQMDVPAMSGLAVFLIALPWGRAIRIAADERYPRQLLLH